MGVEGLTYKQDGKDYNRWLGYARSKTANVLFAVALAKRMEKLGGAAYSLTPGGMFLNTIACKIEY